METRTAPRWIRKREASYRRARWVWRGVMVLGWLGWAGSMLIRQMPEGPGWDAMKVECLTAFLALLILAPGKRSRRCEVAARTIDIAIVRYEASPDAPESLLNEAAIRAREIMRVERVRRAPEWIRKRRRGYRLRILAWICPALLALALPAAAAVLRWPWVEPWHAAAFFGALILYSVGALVGTRKPMKARNILGKAIDRYEYEAAATEGELEEADRLASEACATRPATP